MFSAISTSTPKWITTVIAINNTVIKCYTVNVFIDMEVPTGVVAGTVARTGVKQ